MPKSRGKPKIIEAEMERSNREEHEPTDRSPVPQHDEPEPEEASSSAEDVQSDDWWSASATAPEWAESDSEPSVTEVTRSKEPGTADVYFCGRTNLFPLIRGIQAIAKENLTGLLRSFWDEEPIDLLARDAEIVLVTTRDPDLYCPETPELLTNVDVVLVDRARDQQKESGIPFLLTLAREEAIDREPALELMKHYGQKLFSQLWTAPEAWIMFEKNTELLSDFEELSGEPDVEDWALETLRLVQDPELTEKFDPALIPAFTKEGFERVQKLKLSSDEAQFASQFNGARSVQQIAKNLRLDLRSARQLLFRFVALEIVECWPASTAPKPRKQSLLGRIGRLVRRDR
jgi:hypothetical protein